jgi:hypothetical protein
MMREAASRTISEKQKTPRESGAFYLVFIDVGVPIAGTTLGLLQVGNPIIMTFQIDVISPKWPGGSETDISLPPLPSRNPLLLLR